MLSVSKKPQKIPEAPGAIFVITQEDNNFLHLFKSNKINWLYFIFR